MPLPLTEVADGVLARAGVRLYLKRNDLISSAFPGFIAEFAARHGLTLEWVCVVKMMYGIYARAGQGSFAPGRTVVAVITDRGRRPRR
jgi:hypothetical protein